MQESVGTYQGGVFPRERLNTVLHTDKGASDRLPRKYPFCRQPFQLGLNGGREIQTRTNYPIVLGYDATADKFGRLIGFPTSVLISSDGRVVMRVDGLVSFDEIDKAIQSQLEANESASH
jgi:hypothetical protein